MKNKNYQKYDYFYTLLLFVVYITDVSNKLNKNLSVISLELIGILTFLLCVSSDMETNPFITVKDVYTNIQSKIKINGLQSDTFTLTLCKKFARGAYSLCFYRFIAAEVLASFINANQRIKGIQIGDHEIKMVSFADDTTIFLRDITYPDRIQVILKLYKDASSSKINFSKSQASAEFPLKYLKLTLATLFSTTPNGTK